jgi:tetratricopeptide (TPR) repeat protein
MKKLVLVFLLAVIVLAGCSRNPKAERDKYYASGMKYLDGKRYEEASIEFKNALRADKDHVPSYLGIAKAFQQKGDHQNAINAYQQVVKLDSKNVTAKLRIGEYLLASGASNRDLLKQAQQITEDILKTEPSNVEALILNGIACEGQDDTQKAIQLFEKALVLDPGNLKAMLNLASARNRNKDTNGAEAMFREALQKHPEAIEPHLVIAAFYESTQRPQEAENYLKKAFSLAPADPRCLYALTKFYISAKKFDEAEGIFKEAVARKPKEMEPRWGLANFYFRRGRQDMGIATLNEALNANPGNRAVLLSLAEVYISQNNLAKAEESVRPVLASNKNDAQAHYLLGVIQRNRQEPDKAMGEFEAAIKADSTLLPAYMEKSNLLLMRGDLEECETTLKTVLQRNNKFLPARGAYARLLAIRQKPQEALQMAKEVLAQAPNNVDALSARAEALRLSGKLNESKSDWTRLCQINPKNAFYWYRLGSVETMQSETQSALAHYRKAVELQPRFVVAINDIASLLSRSKQYDAALAELDRLAKLSAPLDEIHKYRGQVYLAKGDTQQAEAELRKSIDINPQNYQAYILLGNLSLKKKNIPQAIKEVDQLIARNNKLPAAYLMKAYYLQLAADTQGSMASYRKVLELDKENTVAANNLAWMMCNNNMSLDEALALAQAARRKSPDSLEVADTLGWIYYKMNNYALAVDQLSYGMSNRKQPEAVHYYHLGMAQYKKGDLIQAKQNLKKALELDPKFSDADEIRATIKGLNY